MAMAPETPGNTIGTLAYHAIDYDPVDAVFVFITDYTSGRRVWAYRYKTAGSPATMLGSAQR